MSTHCTIAVKVNDAVHIVYCHFDGYLSYTGEILLEYYNSQELAEKLIQLGDLAQIGPSTDCPEGHAYTNSVKGYCVYYGRDRHEDWDCVQPMKARSYNAAIRNRGRKEYNYLWNGEKWKVNGKTLTRKEL